MLRTVQVTGMSVMCHPFQITCILGLEFKVAPKEQKLSGTLDVLAGISMQTNLITGYMI